VKPIPFQPVKTSFFPFNGGLDLVTPPLSIANGVMRFCTNLEIGVNGGYVRSAGYERYSGKAKPSDAVYGILTCTITGVVAVGDVLTDNAGTTYGTVIALPSGQAVMTLFTGTFSTGNIKVAGVTVGTCTGAQDIGAASTPALNATYTNLTADVYRALIAVVPGSGSVLGVHQYNNNVYALRNDSAGTYAVLHVKSTSGWTEVALGREISFTSGGTYEIVAGNTITGATSAATAVITKVILTSGTWAAGTAAGRLFFASQTGTFQSENLDVGVSTNVATIAGNSSAITLSPSGRYEFENWNFGGGTGTKKMYGCDGVNRGFEFDGTTWVKISTGMTTDTPTHLHIHKNHLFFSFAGSLQHSGTSTPYTWSAISGAAELACGDTITGILAVPGSETNGAMAIFTSNRSLILYGNDSADWNLVPLSEEAGAIAYTNQFIGHAVSLDQRGITLLTAVQSFGNFKGSVISEAINPLLINSISSASASCVSRKKNQYRLFFSDGSAVYMTMKGQKVLGMTSMSFPNDVTCISSLEGASGLEEIYFGSSNGYVYQMDIGTSFDGDAIYFNGELAFNHFGSPRQLKQFRKCALEISGNYYAEFTFGYSLGYGSTEFEAGTTSSQTSTLSGTNWDSFTWDAFFWDGVTLSPSECDMTGTAENVSIKFSGSSDEFQPFTFNSAIVHFTERRLMR